MKTIPNIPPFVFTLLAGLLTIALAFVIIHHNAKVKQHDHQHKTRIATCKEAQAGERLTATIDKQGERHCIYTREQTYAAVRRRARL